MKYDRTETAPSGKRRLCIYLSEDDAEILDGLAKTALEHMPQTEKTAKTYERLRSMRRCFREIRETVAGIPVTTPLGAPNSAGRFNIDVPAMKAALEEQGRSDRDFFTELRGRAEDP